MAKKNVMTIAGVSYEIADLDFTNMMCDLEDNGIDVMGLIEGENKKYMSLCRGITAVVTKKPIEEAGLIFTNHIATGGAIEDIITPFMDALEAAGFMKEEKATVSQIPQKKTTKKSQESEPVAAE